MTPPAIAFSYRGYADEQTVMDLGVTHLHHAAMMHMPAPGPFNVTNFELPPAQTHPYFYVGVYAAITLSTGLINICGAIVQYTGALRASRVLFDRLLRSVVLATMRWHDVTPQGEVLFRQTPEEMLNTLQGECSTGSARQGA